MLNMKNYKIKKKLSVTFTITLALFMVTVIVSIFGLTYGGNQIKDFYNYTYKLSNTTLDIRRGLQTSIKALGLSMLTEDKTQSNNYINEVETQMQSVRDNLQWLLDNYRGDKTNISNALNGLDGIKNTREQIQSLAAQNKNSEASKLFFDEYNPKLLEIRDIIVAMDENTDKLADSTYKNSYTIQIIIEIIAIVICVITFAIVLYLSKRIADNISRPIIEIEEAAKLMTHGEFDNINIEYESEDELGSLANSMRATVERIGNYMDMITNGLSQIADLDMNVQKQEEFVGIFSSVQQSVRKLIGALNGSIGEIAQSADQVNIGAEQMAENAQSLAEGASEQASAIEELTATVESVSEMARTSAKTAVESAEKTLKAVDNAQEGKERMNELVQAMENISEVSLNIQNIIGAIEDIASQTNLLSLNASIEAARAGEAGKGFAVVADQIGKLATDSAKSAVETRELISKSLQEIESGNIITQKTVAVLEGIIQEMGNFAEMAKATSEASNSQAQLLEQIEGGIEQIATVVQNNSASAQESSATSEELSAQAESLKSIVSQFTLKE